MPLTFEIIVQDEFKVEFKRHFSSVWRFGDDLPDMISSEYWVVSNSGYSRMYPESSFYFTVLVGGLSRRVI